MDLGIGGRKALVCGASKGLGRACATSLAREGVLVTIIARGAEALAAAAGDIEGESGLAVIPVVGDITTTGGRAAALAACPDPDILVTNAGGPAPGDFRNWERQDWIVSRFLSGCFKPPQPRSYLVRWDRLKSDPSL